MRKEGGRHPNREHRADRILALRANDGSNVPRSPYVSGTASGITSRTRRISPTNLSSRIGPALTIRLESAKPVFVPAVRQN